MKATYPELESQLKGLANSDSVLQAVGLAAARDRSFLVGPEADAMLSLFDVDRANEKSVHVVVAASIHAGSPLNHDILVNFPGCSGNKTAVG